MIKVPRKIYIKARDKIKGKSFIENGSEILRDQEIQKGRDRVPMTHPSRTTKPRSTLTIKDKRKGGGRKTSINPFDPGNRKVHFLEGSKDGLPVN